MFGIRLRLSLFIYQFKTSEDKTPRKIQKRENLLMGKDLRYIVVDMKLVFMIFCYG
jgi:hypothetical protein